MQLNSNTKGLDAPIVSAMLAAYPAASSTTHGTMRPEQRGGGFEASVR